MEHIAVGTYGGQKVFANGGAGLFLIDGDEARAEEYGQHIQSKYRKNSDGGASITYAVQELPDGMNTWGADTRLEQTCFVTSLRKRKAPRLPSFRIPRIPFYARAVPVVRATPSILTHQR